MGAQLSVYILAYNSEDRIGCAVESVLWADEVVVVDSFSEDKTAEIAEQLGAKVVQVEFEGFGKLRLAEARPNEGKWDNKRVLVTGGSDLLVVK